MSCRNEWNGGAVGDGLVEARKRLEGKVRASVENAVELSDFGREATSDDEEGFGTGSVVSCRRFRSGSTSGDEWVCPG